MTPHAATRGDRRRQRVLVFPLLAAVSLPVNLLIIALFHWAATHQTSQTQSADAVALGFVALLFVLTGGMLVALRRGLSGLSVGLAVAQLLPMLVLGACLALPALR